MARRWFAAVILVLAAHALGAATLQEFGIEGMGVVSTADSEVRASVSPDGQRIVWGSRDRKGGAGGYDLWQATRHDGRWIDPRPLSIDTAAKEFDPMFSADGRWLYFFSDRDGGFGGDDLYRSEVLADGGFGPPDNLGPGVNGAGNEWAPTPSNDGTRLLFASDGHGGAGRHDLLVARWDGKAFVVPEPVPGINTAGDEFDAAWLEGGSAIAFAYAPDIANDPVRLMIAHCDGKTYVDAQPVGLPFNGPDDNTYGPVVDLSRPSELLVNGIAKAPSAGKQDIYRVRIPRTTGKAGCL